MKEEAIDRPESPIRPLSTWMIASGDCGHLNLSDNQAMLEFRRKSNDLQTRVQLFGLTIFAIPFVGLLIGGIFYQNLPCILIGLLCCVIVCGGLVRCIKDLLNPYDHVCIFTPSCVHWFATNEAYPPGRIDSSNVRSVCIDLDDTGLSFDTGSLIASGIRAEFGLTIDKLKVIRDYIVAHWTSVTVYCIERGTRRCESANSFSQNDPMDRNGRSAGSR